jgi:ferredoxin
VSTEPRVTVDPERCVGSGTCEFWAPEVFEVGDDGVAVVVGDTVVHAHEVAQAVDGCPTEAISVAPSGSDDPAIPDAAP